MTTDPPSGTVPFASQTDTNTGSQDWLSSYGTIKADFGSLADYASNMWSAALDLIAAVGPLSEIPQLTNHGFQGKPPFPEAALAALYVNTNYSDLMTMLTDLHVGIQNTAYAAQTISDAYHLNDDGSSKDLNSLISVDGVDFAFGMGGARPKGLDKSIGKTWMQESGGNTFSQAAANSGAVSDASDPSQLGGTMATSYLGPSDHQTKVTTITYPDGSSIKIEESSAYPGGPSFMTTSVIGADGKTQSATRKTTTTSGGSTKVVTETADKQGGYHESGSQTTTTTKSADGSAVTKTTNSSVQDGKETPSGSTTDTTHADGSTETDTTTVSHNQDGSTSSSTSKQAVGDNDNDVNDQQGDKDPKAYDDKHYTNHGAPAVSK